MDNTKEEFKQYNPFINKYELFIWDFDLTILKIHSYATDIKEEEVRSLSWKKLMCHFADPIFFRDLIYFLIENKKKVAIVSFAKYNVIKAYLDRLFDDTNIFGMHNIITPVQNCKKYNRNLRIDSDKNQYIIDLSREHNIDYKNILFFDDTYTNTNNAKDLGVTAIQIDSKKGFVKEVWNKVALNNMKPEKYNEMNSKIKYPLDTSNEKKKEYNHNPETLISQESQTKSNKNSNVTEGFENQSNFNILSMLSSFQIKQESVGWINIFSIVFIIIYFYLRNT
jgi:hypothetical protein